MRRYMGYLHAIGEDGEYIPVAIEVPIDAENDFDARQRLYEEHWDDRLSATSCAALAEVHPIC